MGQIGHSHSAIDHVRWQSQQNMLNKTETDKFNRMGVAWVMPERVVHILKCWKGLRGNVHIAAVEYDFLLNYVVFVDGEIL